MRKQVLLIFSKNGVNIDELGTVAYHRLGSTDRIIIKLLNRKDALKLLELKYVNLLKNCSHKNYNKDLSSDQVSVSEQVKNRKNFSYKKPKLFLNQCLCPYYIMLYGRVKRTG